MMKKSLIWIGAIIGIGLCFVGGFSVGKYFSEKDKKKGNQTVTETKKEEEKEEIKEEIFKEADLSESEKTKLKEIIEILPEKASLTNLEKDLTNNEKISFAMAYDSLINNHASPYLSGTIIKNILSQSFGSDLNVKLENIKCSLCDVDYYIYDSKTDVYGLNPEHPGHGASGIDAYNVVNSYKQNGNKIVLEVDKMYYATSDSFEFAGYYSNYNDLINNKNYKEIKDENLWGDFESVYKLEKDNLPTYTYTFEKAGDNFIFKGYELSK